MTTLQTAALTALHLSLLPVLYGWVILGGVIFGG